MFLKFSENSQETCNLIKIETLAQMFPCEFCKISKYTFFHRTPPMAAPIIQMDQINEIRSKAT